MSRKICILAGCIIFWVVTLAKSLITRSARVSVEEVGPRFAGLHRFSDAKRCSGR